MMAKADDSLGAVLPGAAAGLRPACERWLEGDPRRRLLLVFATVKEMEGALGLRAAPEAEVGPWSRRMVGPRVEALVSGVGKANAAGAVGFALGGVEAEERRCTGVVSVGIAGALPRTAGVGGWAVEVGSVVAGSASVWGDEGVQTPERFLDCWAMGFPLAATPGAALPADGGLLEVFAAGADVAGAVATVSTCSGTDALARAVAERTGAVAEAMEGAAVLQVARRLGCPAVEVRAISNTTGDRAGQRWDIAAALARLRRVFGRG